MASIPTPLTSPQGPGFKSASLTSKNFGMSHELNGAAVVTVKTVGQAWDISVQYNTMSHSQFSELDAFLESLNGNMEAFQILLPQYRQLGIADLGVASSSSTGETAVTMDSVTGLNKGMLIQFSTGTKVYKVNNIVGNIITLNTGLYSAVTSASTAKVSDIEFTCKLSGAPNIVTNENKLIEGFSLQMKETIL